MIFESTIRQCTSEYEALLAFAQILIKRKLIAAQPATILWQPTLFTDLPDAIVQAEVTKEK